MRYGTPGESSGGGSSGGMTEELLWTNPDPSAAFSAQTVSLDLSAYEFIDIVGIADATGSTYMHFVNRFVIGELGRLTKSGRNADPPSFNRDVTTSTTGVTFSTGYRNSTAGTRYAIPVRIYGIKF